MLKKIRFILSLVTQYFLSQKNIDIKKESDNEDKENIISVQNSLEIISNALGDDFVNDLALLAKFIEHSPEFLKDVINQLKK